MKTNRNQPLAPQEVELKLSLPTADPKRLQQQLAGVPVLKRRQATHQTVYNIYFDTPDQQLRQQRVVLRLRRIGDEASGHWLQTLKTGTSDVSALSQRGEWESPVDAPALSRHALQATPWAVFNADDSLFTALAPCFVTTFERTTWLVRKRDGSVVEVALDLGQIQANSQSAPICELELELKAGPPSALFTIAQEIARTVTVLPAGMSKAQRGFLLGQGGVNQPYRAPLPRLFKTMSVQLMAQQILRSALAQFTNNLDILRSSEEAEVVHQARIGWRRFKSAQRLFRKLMPVAAPEPSEALATLLASLGDLRNLDVAQTGTLPPFADAFMQGDTQRAKSWQSLMVALTQATDSHRAAVRSALQKPATGASLLALLQWVEGLPADGQLVPELRVSLRQWARHRMQRLNKQLQDARKVADTPEQWHRVRILAKRLRYGSENLQDLLPNRLARQSMQRAEAIQNSLGATRDLGQLSALVAALALEPGVAQFLRGVVVGAGRR